MRTHARVCPGTVSFGIGQTVQASHSVNSHMIPFYFFFSDKDSLHSKIQVAIWVQNFYLVHRQPVEKQKFFGFVFSVCLFGVFFLFVTNTFVTKTSQTSS